MFCIKIGGEVKYFKNQPPQFFILVQNPLTSCKDDAWKCKKNNTEFKCFVHFLNSRVFIEKEKIIQPGFFLAIYLNRWVKIIEKIYTNWF